ncbi:MAG: DoxX family protein [Xanthomonadales bacterium]|nr:DoxX family protein [Xanthomonadales bacterium]
MNILKKYDDLTARLKASGDYIWPLALRLIMFWEFWEAGIGKYRGDNWFAGIPWADWQMGFPWPFNILPADINWMLATWGELIFSVLILLGLFTRFAAFSLLVITVVATAAVHWPAEWNSLAELWSGYVITAEDAGNFKLPLLFVLLLLPLIFHGGGKISLDFVLLGSRRRSQRDAITGDLAALAAGLLVLGATTIFLLPVIGYAFLGLALLTALAHVFIG